MACHICLQVETFTCPKCMRHGCNAHYHNSRAGIMCTQCAMKEREKLPFCVVCRRTVMELPSATVLYSGCMRCRKPICSDHMVAKNYTYDDYEDGILSRRTGQMTFCSTDCEAAWMKGTNAVLAK